MSFWPLYRENILQGPTHVSLALPGKPSAISKSVNGTQPALLLIPNLDFLRSFVKGDVGIAQGIMTNSLFTNINSPAAANDEMVARKFAEINRLEIGDIGKYKKPDGKIKIPKSEIQPSSAFDMTGLKATEKTILTSIFETQKPYMEIAKIVVDLMVKSEDIVARIMPLLSINPLTSKSEKPIVKDGGSNGTKAIGYRNGEEIKKILAELEKVSKIGGKLTVNKDGTTSKDRKPAVEKTGEADFSEKDLAGTGKKWKIISTVYSTGEYNPDIEYAYSYNILPPDDEGPNNLTPEAADEDNPFDKYKPKRIILGIFDSDGKPIDPNQTLKTIGFNGNEVAKVDTPIKAADWVFRSPKWKFAENQYIWPSFGASGGDPLYLWENSIGQTKESKKSPGKGWSIKKYKKGDKNIINKIDATEGDPVIAKFDTTDTGEYLKYFTEYTKQKTKMADGLTQEEKDAVVKDIIDGFDIQSHLQNVFLYGSGKSSTYKSPGIPDAMKIAFKPYQIYVPESASDPKLSGDGLVWIDPESDYEFKVIRVDPVSKVDYEAAKGEPAITADVKSFIKNKAVFSISNGAKFNMSISKNGQTETEIKGISEYALENWNYENGKILNQNSFDVTIWSESPGQKYSDGKNKYVFDNTYTRKEVEKNGSGQWTYREFSSSGVETTSDGLKILEDKSRIEVKAGFITKWYYLYKREYNKNSLPQFANEITQTINYDTVGNGNAEPKIASATKVISLYSIKVTNPSDKYEIVIDPTKVRNDALTTENLFSKGRYGTGTAENPQEIEIIKRYALTDLDTKSYYIIEGIAVDENSREGGATNANASGDSGSKWYRLPHAIGAAIVFLKMLVDVATKLFPAIKKLITLFSNPTKFVTDIITEKVGESFAIFSPEAFEKLKYSKKIIDKKEDIIAQSGRPSDYSDQLKRNFETSPLVNHVHVNQFSNPGKIKPLPDGTAMIPFEIFGKSIPFGMELKMANLIPENVQGAAIPKSPLKLILGKPGKAKSKDCGSSGIEGDGTGNSNADSLNELNNPATDNNANKRGQTKNENDYYVTSTWYSTGQFLKGVDYNYYYITDDTAGILRDVDDLINGPEGTPPLPENLQLAKEMIENALKKDPDNEALKSKLKDINAKMLESAMSTQPILKLALGMVATPIKVISCIVQWIMDFFKSLKNPMKLPAKIIELLSFKWIMKFFSPQGLLKTAGVEFNPSIIKEYASLSKIPNTPGFEAGGASTSAQKGGFPTPDKSILNNIKPHRGKYAIPDNFQLANLSKFVNVSFMASLPAYSSRDIRENADFPKQFSNPVLCLIEKILNAFIDFVWSTLGIEAVIPPPHIKLCKEKTPEDTAKVLNGEKPTNETDGTTEVVSTNPYEEKKATDDFIYEVKLPDGKVVTLLNQEDLDKFIQENKDISYDFQF